MDGFFTVTLKRESYIAGNVGDSVSINFGINVGIEMKVAKPAFG